MRKMKRIFISVAIIGIILICQLSTFMVSAGPIIGSTTVTLYTISDSYVISSSPDSNYGSNATLLTELDSVNSLCLYHV